MEWSKILPPDRIPEPFFPGDGSFWADPYISSHVVLAHLDQSSDDASRPLEKIDRECAWIHSLFPRPGRCLDLGCGPGLYSRELALKGWQVTGFDVSPASIGYARREARALDLETVFHLADFLKEEFPGNQDLILLVFGTFCTLSPADARLLVDKCARALAPGGRLVLDVFGKNWWQRELDREPEEKWDVLLKEGFWNPSPHLVLSRSYVYSELRVFGRLYTVIEDHRTRVFPFWYRWYTPEHLSPEFFSGWDLSFFASLEGQPWQEGGDWTAVVAQKEADHAAQQSL